MREVLLQHPPPLRLDLETHSPYPVPPHLKTSGRGMHRTLAHGRQQDLSLKAKAKIWPRLSYMCYIHSTEAPGNAEIRRQSRTAPQNHNYAPVPFNLYHIEQATPRPLTINPDPQPQSTLPTHHISNPRGAQQREEIARKRTEHLSLVDSRMSTSDSESL